MNDHLRFLLVAPTVTGGHNGATTFALRIPPDFTARINWELLKEFEAFVLRSSQVLGIWIRVKPDTMYGVGAFSLGAECCGSIEDVHNICMEAREIIERDYGRACYIKRVLQDEIVRYLLNRPMLTIKR